MERDEPRDDEYEIPLTLWLAAWQEWMDEDEGQNLGATGAGRWFSCP